MSKNQVVLALDDVEAAKREIDSFVDSLSDAEFYKCLLNAGYKPYEGEETAPPAN